MSVFPIGAIGFADMSILETFLLTKTLNLSASAA